MMAIINGHSRSGLRTTMQKLVNQSARKAVRAEAKQYTEG